MQHRVFLSIGVQNFDPSSASNFKLHAETHQAQETIENRCEACFGIGQEVKMKPMRFWYKIAIPPACNARNGTGQKAASSIPKPSAQPTVRRFYL
jgi:hypothetical protein